VDPGRDFVPVRYHQYDRGSLEQTVDITYRSDETHKWVPAGWTNAQFHGSEHLGRSMTVKVTDVRINVELPADLFDLPPLPDGTWVRNYMTDEDYIVQKGGKRRDVTPGEYDGNNYQYLLHSDPPGSRRRWLLRVLLGSVIVLAAMAFVRHVRRRSRSPSN